MAPEREPVAGPASSPFQVLQTLSGFILPGDSFVFSHKYTLLALAS